LSAVFAVAAILAVSTSLTVLAVRTALALWALQLLDFFDFCADFGQLFTEQNGDSRQFCFG
jgi:hypothetical protein